MSRAPSATCWPGSAATSATSPAAGATSACSIFIASTIGEALALLDPVAGLDEDGDELAVHRRLDGAALVDVLEVDREGVVAVDPRLAAVRSTIDPLSVRGDER